MTLADLTSERDLNERHPLWPFIQGWGAELGLTGSDAINRVSRPASSTTGKASDLTPRRDNDHPAPSAPGPET